MPMLTATQIYALAEDAGFSRGEAITATAIALAESKPPGNTDSHNLTSREDSRGLWQINVRAHPEFAGQNLYDPFVNARVARAVYVKQGWRAWSVFKSGAYGRKLTEAREAAPSTGTQLTDVLQGIRLLGDFGREAVEEVPGQLAQLTGLEGIASAATGIVDVVGRVTRWITTPANVGRVAMVVIGGAVLLVALAELAQRALPETSANVVRVAGEVTPG